MSRAAYLFLSISRKSDLVESASEVTSAKGLLRWDALEGQYQLVLKLSGNGDSEFKRIEQIDRVKEVVVCAADTDRETDNLLDPESCHSYLLIEADKENAPGIREAVEKHDEVVFCNETSGMFNIVAVIKGPSFDSIDKVIQMDIIPLDGVLRLKQERVIQTNPKLNGSPANIAGE